MPDPLAALLELLRDLLSNPLALFLLTVLLPPAVAAALYFSDVDP